MSSQASTEIMESVPRRITDWLEDNYPNKRTRFNYYHSLKVWIIFIYGEDSVSISKDQRFLSHREKLRRDKEKRINKIEEGIERYFSELDDRDFTVDFKRFIQWMRKNEYANTTTRNRIRTLKYFFARQKDLRCKIDDDDWAQIKRTLLPKSTRPQTKDDILTKEQLKTVLQYLSIHGRAMALFLLSTGARIGEACQLMMSDINLDSDPPMVDIKNKYTKAEVGGRIMWFSHEARDAIREWHFTRKNIDKSGPEPGPFDEKSVFNYRIRAFNFHWITTLHRADRGRIPPVLAKRDNSTKKKIHVYHTHTLRKFFRTRMGSAGVPDMNVHAWMGHKAYLSKAYDRPDEMAELYKEHMDVVTVHEVAGPITIDEALLDGMAEEIGAYEGLSEEDKEGLSIKEKYLLVKAKLVKIKEEKKVPVAEMEVDAEEHDEFMDLFKEATASSRAPAK